ncbi:MAG: ice-binding family protein [Gallionellaceae bacterium]|nr:ice-binding family protein [Gallionellaceae bacterium]
MTQATLTDVTKPRVTLTVPATTSPGPTLVAPANVAITATFTEAMLPGTITAASFMVVDTTTPGAVAAVTVTYDTASKTAIFTHAGLTVGDNYTATITTVATDMAGNALAGNQAALPAASNYVWTFTASAVDVTSPTVTLTAPADLATAVAINSTVNATFSEAIDPTKICGSANLTAACPVATFTVVNTTLGGTPVAGVASYVANSNIATFTPSSNLATSTLFTATVTNVVTDLAGNTLIAGVKPNPWTFTTGTGLAPGAANFGTASTFGIMATSAITNTGAATIVNGDVSLEPGTSNGLLPIQVNGSIHINDTVSHQARADLLATYNTLKSMSPGTTVPGGTDLGAFGITPGTLAPGTYTSGSTMLVSTPLTLDAGGDANAVWVFQIGSSLTTNVGGGNISLANGAQAKNVFWVPTSDATVGVGTTFNGSIVAGRDATGQTGATINGRILAGAITAGTIALDTNTVNVPLP